MRKKCTLQRVPKTAYWHLESSKKQVAREVTINSDSRAAEIKVQTGEKSSQDGKLQLENYSVRRGVELRSHVTWRSASRGE